MIKEQFLYFARYPDSKGILSMFTNGSSDDPAYNDLVAALRGLPDQSRVPEIANYVYGLSTNSSSASISLSAPTSLSILERWICLSPPPVLTASCNAWR